MANILSRLKIREVSSVDRPANPGARIMLMKRDGGPRQARSRDRSRGRRYNLFQMQEAARAAHAKPKEKKRMAKVEKTIDEYLKRNVVTAAEAVAKRVFSGKERKAAAAAGHAMPGGGYPIEDVGDLHNAIQAIGRAKKPGATRAHIRRQAARLGHSDLIPDTWGAKTTEKRGKKPAFPGAAPPFGAKPTKPSKKTSKLLIKIAKDLGRVARITKDAMDFDETLTEMGSTNYAEGVIEAVRDAFHAFKESVESIAECDDIQPNDKSDAIKESFGQFMQHLSGIAPGNIVKSLEKGAGPMSSLKKRLRKAFESVGQGSNMNPPAKDSDLKEEDGVDPAAGTGNNDPKTATSGAKAAAKLAKKLAKKAKKLQAQADTWEQRAKTAVGLTKAEKDYTDSPDNDMDEDDKKKFLDASPKKRAKMMEARPLAKMTEKRIADLPEPVRKALDEGKAAMAEVTKLNDAAEAQAFAKRANDLGLSATFGPHLHTLAKGLGTLEERQKALEEVEKVIASANEAARLGGVFKEFGSGLAAGGDAYQQLMAKAEELRAGVNKSMIEGQKAMTIEQAFAKVYEDTANAAIVKQYNVEKRRAA